MPRLPGGPARDLPPCPRPGHEGRKIVRDGGYGNLGVVPPNAAARTPWDAALNRYRGLAVDAAAYNVALLEQLRPTWQTDVRPSTSTFTLQFTRYGETGYEFHERVEVEYEAKDRVRIALARQVPRRGEHRPVGPVIVAGDFARPENSRVVVESFLMQLAGV